MPGIRDLLAFLCQQDILISATRAERNRSFLSPDLSVGHVSDLKLNWFFS